MTVHFLDRCKERGLGDVAQQLLADLRKAIRMLQEGKTGADLYIEHVFDLPTHGTAKSKAIYRFMVAEVQYFAVVIDGTIPVTVLTKEMIAFYRSRNRKPSKGRRAAQAALDGGPGRRSPRNGPASRRSSEGSRSPSDGAILTPLALTSHIGNPQ